MGTANTSLPATPAFESVGVLDMPLVYVEPRWYAAYTCPRHEKHVSQQMDAHGIACFLPLYNSMRRWKDRRLQLQLPLFPGYVFVRMALKDRVQVLRLSGVVHLVSFHGLPSALPDHEIEGLRQGLCGNAILAPHPLLKVGRKVRVRTGPMAGIEGILLRRKDHCRVVVTIELIQRSVAMEIDESDVEPIW